MKHMTQKLPSVGVRTVSNHLGGTVGHNLTAFTTALRAQINNPIRGFYHIQIMFNDNDGVTLIS